MVATMAVQSSGKRQIEVFPHPAIVNLFDLDLIIKYKKGRVCARKAELGRYYRLCREDLPRSTPSLSGLDLGEIPPTGSSMKDFEDRLDAVLCAYVGAYWWYWGRERNMVFGDESLGYIIVPNRRIS